MKTADLIPFILLELNECNKYGFELTKAIETKSNGKIVIKQPTLYTLLKKLEKSKFIASYWEDSEIGGKRHYYKLTDNGRLQVSTLPSYDLLLKNALSEDEIEFSNNEITVQQEVSDKATEKRVSIMDELLGPTPAPVESVLPTEEVFVEENIDNSTELEINISNTEMLKNENVAVDEQFATNENVRKFTEKVARTQPIESSIKESINSSQKDNSFLDVDFSIPKNEIEIKYVDYFNLKANDKYKHAKKLTKQLLFKSLATSACLILLLVACSFITRFTGRSGLYYTFFISSILIALFYPILYLVNMEKLRLKYQENVYNPKLKQRLFICITLMLVVLIVCIIVNIYIKNNSFALILGLKNFENLYAPIILSSITLLDLLFNRVFLSKINK